MNQVLKSAMFAPRWWAIAINAHFLPRRELFRAMRDSGTRLCGRVLDVGCGDQPYRELLTSSNEVLGLELDTPQNRANKKHADHFYDGHTIPFDDGSFQGVLCNQVLEHAFNPEILLAEMARVLQPEGILVLSVPFLWPEHEKPFDSQRFTSFGLGSRLNSAGFTILSQKKLVTGTAALCALLADRINAKISRLPLALRLVSRVLLVTPCSAIGCLLMTLHKGNSDLFLDNFVVAKKDA